MHPDRILVVQTAFIGDVVLTTPLLRELRRAHPAARITVVATPGAASLLRGHPAIDELIPFDKKGADRGATGLLSLISRIRAQRFDLGIAAQRSARTGSMLALGRIPVRIGFEGAPGRWAYNHPVPLRKDEHAVRRYLELSAPAGADPAGADPQPNLVVRPEADESASTKLREIGIGEIDRFVVVMPGSVWATKRWLPEGFAEVATWVANRGVPAVIAGGPEERSVCDEVVGRTNDAARLLPPTTLRELAGVLQRARALVGNDSGPGHIATAVGTPVVTVYGATVPALGYYPWGENVRIVEEVGLECRPCSRHGPQTCPLEHFRCMRDIGAERVIAALEEVLEG